MATRAAMPQRGDVLILGTAKSFAVYAVGRVSEDGQEEFSGEAGVTYFHVRVMAEVVAKALVAPGCHIHFLDLDTGEWSEVLAVMR